MLYTVHFILQLKAVAATVVVVDIIIYSSTY